MLHRLLTVSEPSRDDVSFGTVDEAHAQPVRKLPALLVARRHRQPVTASCTTMIAHCEFSGLLRPSKTNNLFGATPVQRAHSVQRLSLRARQTVPAANAARGGNPVRQPREENVAGEFYVDHTCIGGPLLCASKHQPSRQFLFAAGILRCIDARAATCPCFWCTVPLSQQQLHLQTVIHVAGWTQQHMSVLEI